MAPDELHILRKASDFSAQIFEWEGRQLLDANDRHVPRTPGLPGLLQLVEDLAAAQDHPANITHAIIASFRHIHAAAAVAVAVADVAVVAVAAAVAAAAAIVSIAWLF